MRAEGDTPPTPTVESVYGKPLADLKPPKGFRFTGEFRPPSDYPEKFMEDGVVCSYGTDPRLPREGRLPRLILKPAKRLVFDILDERPVQRGERFWFGDEVLICRSGGSREVNQSILSEPRVEE